MRERLAGPGRGRVLGRAVWFCPTPARCHTGAVESSLRRTRLDPAASGRGLGCQEHRWPPAVPGRGGARPVPAAGPGMPPPAELTVQERQRAQCHPLEPRRGSFMPHPGGAHCGVGGGGLGSSLSQTGLDDASFEFRQGVTLPVAKVEGPVQQAASSSRCQCVNRLGVCCWDRVRPAPGPRPLRLHRSVAFPGCPAAVHVSIPRGGPRVQAKAA